MAKAGAKRRDDTAGAETRRRIVAAALDTLREEGFAGTSARAIATRAGVSQAAVFYHFGRVEDLLLAALDETAARRMERYEAAVDGASTLPGLLEVAAEVYREDLASGHLAVLAEMVGGASSSPDLGAAIAQKIEPWVRFTEQAVGRVLEGSPLAVAMPVADVAFAIVALYLGMEMLTHLDGDTARAESLFSSAQQLGGLLAPLLGGGAS